MKTIHKKNEVIAEFMGLTYHEDSNEWTNREGHVIWIEQTPPPYDVSHDWIIPVINRIRVLYVTMQVDKKSECLKVLNSKITTSIEILQDRVYSFIKSK